MPGNEEGEVDANEERNTRPSVLWIMNVPGNADVEADAQEEQSRNFVCATGEDGIGAVWSSMFTIMLDFNPLVYKHRM